MRNLITILVFCLCANVALGGIVVSAPSSGLVDPGGVWPTAGAEYRLGATARNMAEIGDWEMGIGTNGSMNSGAQVDLLWGGPGTLHDFVLDYDPLAKQATWIGDGTNETSVVLQNPAPLFTDMNIQLKGRPASSQAYLSISNTTITVEGFDVTSIDDFAAGYGEADELQYIHINHSDEPLSDMDFVLAGTLYIDWTGTAPTNDVMGIHVNLTQIPEPASIIMVILVSATGLFVRRWFR